MVLAWGGIAACFGNDDWVANTSFLTPWAIVAVTVAATTTTTATIAVTALARLAVFIKLHRCICADAFAIDGIGHLLRITWGAVWSVTAIAVTVAATAFATRTVAAGLA